MSEFKYDEIGPWSETKLAIIKDYTEAYTTVMHRQSHIRKYIYVDAFAGPGMHLSKRTGKLIKGSPLNALGTKSPFSEIHLIDSDPVKVAELRRLATGRPGVHAHVYEGDANAIVPREVFPRCRWGDHNRALCLLDPYDLGVDWRVVQQAGQMKSVEILYNFMIMDAQRNILWRKRENVSEAQAARLDFVWGDRSWETVAYVPQLSMFGDPVAQKAGNRDIAEAFRRRIRDVAGFNFVLEPMAMRNSLGFVIYYLFFASNSEAGAKIMKDVFRKYTTRGAK